MSDCGVDAGAAGRAVLSLLSPLRRDLCDVARLRAAEGGCLFCMSLESAPEGEVPRVHPLNSLPIGASAMTFSSRLVSPRADGIYLSG